MKILLAVDGSASSNAAVESVATRPWPQGSEVKILSVAEIHYLATTEFGLLPPSYYDEIQRVAQELAQANINAAVAVMQQRQTTGLTVSTEHKTGFAKSVILEEAKRWGADLIVLGSHGYSGLERFLLGSVSQAVATHALCSVEIVRDKALYTKRSL